MNRASRDLCADSTVPPKGRPADVVHAFSEAPDANADGGSLAGAENLLPADLLDGNEIVILAFKPSLWFVVFVSFRWVLASVLVIFLIGFCGCRVPFLGPRTVAEGAAAFAAARVGFALLQWVSRLYVLTNRRILRLRGVFNIDLFECSLSKVQNTFLTFAWYERLVGLGSICFATAGTDGIEAAWLHLNRPLEVHQQVRSAIERAQKNDL